MHEAMKAMTSKKPEISILATSFVKNEVKSLNLIKNMGYTSYYDNFLASIKTFSSTTSLEIFIGLLHKLMAMKFHFEKSKENNSQNFQVLCCVC